MKFFIVSSFAFLLFAGCKARNFGEATESVVKDDNHFQQPGDMKDDGKKTIIECKNAEKSSFDLKTEKLQIKFSKDASKYWSKQLKADRKLVYLSFYGAMTQSFGQPVLATDLQENDGLAIELFQRKVNHVTINDKEVWSADESGSTNCKINGMSLRNDRLHFELDCGVGPKISLDFKKCELNKDNLKDAQKLLN